MSASCRHVDQHAKRAVKAEGRFFRHTPTPRASCAVHREPDGAISRHTEEKICFRFCIGFARWPDRNPRGVSMAAQERESKRNFIAILSDSTEAQRVVESLAKSDRPVSRALLRLMAAVLNRGVNGGIRPQPRPLPGIIARPTARDAK
jgi:hypothetical protein